MSEVSRLQWQCRRGMRELDILLKRYLDSLYMTSDAEEKLAFQQLLALSDPELAGYLLRNIPHDEVPIANVIARILGCTPA